jgi:hypothetical protein
MVILLFFLCCLHNQQQCQRSLSLYHLDHAISVSRKVKFYHDDIVSEQLDQKCQGEA